MKKNVFLLIVLLLMAVVFSGCGKTEMTEPAETESEEAVLVETEVVEETEEEPQEETGAAEVTDEDFQIFDLGDGTCEIGACYMEASVIEVPEVISELTVVGIGSNAFSTDGIEEIILPDTVVYISDAGFNMCQDLKQIDFGKGLKEIGSGAFSNCPKLESATFPDGMESIGAVLFGTNSILSEVYIPESATLIDSPIAFIEMTPNIVIVTPAGSAAEKMAIAAGLPVRNS